MLKARYPSFFTELLQQRLCQPWLDAVTRTLPEHHLLITGICTLPVICHDARPRHSLKPWVIDDNGGVLHDLPCNATGDPTHGSVNDVVPVTQNVNWMDESCSWAVTGQVLMSGSTSTWLRFFRARVMSERARPAFPEAVAPPSGAVAAGYGAVAAGVFCASAVLCASLYKFFCMLRHSLHL